MFQTNLIVAQDQINCLQNTKEYFLVMLGRTLFQIKDQIQLKTGNPLANLFCFISILLILCLLVHENHQHVQGWNPITTTSFSVRHNNNNKHGEKPKNKLGGERKEVVLV